MKILDWRPWWVRLGTSLWNEGSAGISGTGTARRSPGPPLAWTEGLHANFMSRRIAARSAPPEDVFVLSIGNLALGGTGKTPVTLALARDLATLGRRGAILTRGFGSRLKGPLVVEPDNGLAGDEARLMAASMEGTGWMVVQAQDRQAGLEWLRKEHPGLDLVIAEDAHQTAGLGRHLDIVILHSWREGPAGIEPAPGPVVPFGPWRESAAGAMRAGIWLLEGETRAEGGTGGSRIVTFGRSMFLAAPEGLAPDPGREVPWAALAGIARPGRFENGTAALRGRDASLAIRPGDHAQYGPRSVSKIKTAMKEAGVGLLVTTAKDWVKLGDWWDGDIPVLVADLAITWKNDRTLPDLVGERLDAWKDRAAR